MIERLRAPRVFVCRHAWFWICAVWTLLKLWLVNAGTLSALAPSPHDDQLFLSHAASLLRGEWLGPLTDLTLVKGPVYSLWLALNELTGLRLLLSQAILYIIACVVLGRAVRPLLGEPWRRAFLYLAVLFNPASWADGPATHVAREGIYPGLSMMLLGLAIGAALRLRDAPRKAALWASAAGLVGALFVMTREEGVWLAPSLVIITLLGLSSARRAGWRTWLPASAAVAIAYLLPTAAIAGINWKTYGQYETCETRAGYYKAAYGALTRVKASTWNPYVPVPVEARAKVFAVSPAFREIAPLLERWAGNWTSFGCQAVGVCDDIAGGWFLWAFRAAVAGAGEYRDGQTARGWYERLTREVDLACRSGALECLPARASMMPPWRLEYLRPVASSLARATVFASTFSAVTPYATPPRGDEPELAEFERITHERLPRYVTRLQGVLTSRGGEVLGTVIDHLSGPVKSSIQRGLAVPVVASNGGGRSIRLDVTALCAADCTLLLFATDGSSLAVPLSDPSKARGDPSLEWSTERAALRPLEPPDPASRARLAVLAVLTRGYALTMPFLSVLALLLLAARLVRAARARTIPVLSLIALPFLVGVVMRLLVLALVDATSFPAINVHYMSPAYALLIAFVALVLLTGAEPTHPSPPAVLRPDTDDLPPAKA